MDTKETTEATPGFKGAPYGQLHQLRVTMVELPEGEGVEITGEVTTWYMKQLAQEFLRKRVNGHRIINNVVVKGG